MNTRLIFSPQFNDSRDKTGKFVPYGKIRPGQSTEMALALNEKNLMRKMTMSLLVRKKENSTSGKIPLLSSAFTF